MDCRYDFTFFKNMKTAVPPSYLDAQTIKFREICIIWWPTSIENFTFCKNEFLAQINMLLGFVDQIFKNLLVFVVIYTFRPDLVTTESLLNKRNSELQLNRRQRSLGQWLRPMSLRAPLEYSKDWLWSLCKWNENERSFSFSSKRDTSFPGHKPPYFVEITVFSTNLESISGGWAASAPYKNSFFTVKNASSSTLSLLNFPKIEKNIQMEKLKLACWEAPRSWF